MSEEITITIQGDLVESFRWNEIKAVSKAIEDSMVAIDWLRVGGSVTSEKIEHQFQRLEEQPHEHNRDMDTP